MKNGEEPNHLGWRTRMRDSAVLGDEDVGVFFAKPDPPSARAPFISSLPLDLAWKAITGSCLFRTSHPDEIALRIKEVSDS